MSQPPAEQAPRPLTDLALWLIRSYPTEPGWDELRLSLRPLRDKVHFQAIEVRGEQRTGKIGQLLPGNPPYDQTRALQDSQLRPGAGTWIESSIVVAATGWPQPSFRVTGQFSRDAEPAPWKADDQALDATDLVHHLTRYPRQPGHVPAWVRDRILAAGLEVPIAPAEDETHPVDTTAIPVVVDIDPAESADDVPRADRPRPEALDISVDRDGPVLADGTRPGRRRYRLGGSLRLIDVLETIGSPLPFLDDHGTWIVRHGQQRDAGRILAVLEQGTGAGAGRHPEVTVHLLSNVEPVDLLDDDDRLELYYCSVPGELEVVIDSARLGEVSLPPAPADPPNNEAVRDAVAAFAETPGQPAMFHVLRQALGGRLVLDATGTELPAAGGRQTQFQLATLTLPDGGRGLGVFTSNKELLEFRNKSATAPADKITGLAQSGTAVLTMFRDNPDIGWLVVNPGGPSCPIGKPAATFALSAPSNSAVKNLLGRTHTAQELVTALSVPDAHLFVAQRTTESGQVGPAMLRDKNDGKPIMIAFTSPAEIAAYNPEMGVLKLPVSAVLQLTLANRAKALILDPGGPRATLASAQVWHMLGNPELPAPAEPAPAVGGAAQPATEGGPGQDGPDQDGPAADDGPAVDEPAVDGRTDTGEDDSPGRP